MFTIYLFNKYKFSSYYVPGITLDSGDLIIKKNRHCPARRWVPSWHMRARPRKLELGNRKAALQTGRPQYRNLEGEPKHRPIIGAPPRLVETQE